MMFNGKRARCWMIVLLWLVCAAGIRGLDADGIWYDEFFSLQVVGEPYQPAPDILTVIERTTTQDINQTPLFFVLQNRWMSLTGWSHQTNRYLSTLFGLLTVALVYRLGTSLQPDSQQRHLIGLSAAVFTGTSAFFILYLHEIRTYMLTLMLSVAVLLVYWRLITRPRPPGLPALMGFSLLTAALFYLHYYAAILPAMLAIYHLLAVPKTRRWWGIVLAWAVAAGLFLPWLLMNLATITGTSVSKANNLLNITPADTLYRLLYAFSNGLIPLAGILIGLSLLRWRVPGVRLLLWTLVGSIAGLMLLNVGILGLVTNLRYLLPVWMLLALAAAIGLSLLAQSRLRWLTFPVLLLWIITGFWQSTQPAFNQVIFDTLTLDGFRRFNVWNQVATVLDRDRQPDDVVLLNLREDGWRVNGAINYHLQPLPVQVITLPEDDDPAPVVVPALEPAVRLWIVSETGDLPAKRLTQLERFLTDSGFSACEEMSHSLTGVSLRLYSRLPVCCSSRPPATSPLLTFAPGVTLVKIAYPAQTDSERLPLTLAIAGGDHLPPGTHSLAIHADTATGEFVSQVDTALPTEAYQCRRLWLPLTDIPPDTLTLHALIYDWQTGVRLQSADGTDRPPVGTVRLQPQ